MSAWPWPSSDSTGEIIPAFVGALQTFDGVTKARRVNIPGKDGKQGANYAYADLGDVLDVVKPVLEAAGLAITQAAADDGVHTLLLHTSGEWVSWPPLTVRTGQNTPQAQGSALTYSRRYSILAALNLATEDDDGQAAAVPAPKPVKTAARKEAEAVYDDLLKLDVAARDTFKAWADGRKFSADALEADADWRVEVSNWLSEWEHNREQVSA